MTAELKCPCGAQTWDQRFLCGECEQVLTTDLRALPTLIRELDVEVTRQAVKNPSPGAAGEAGVGFDVAASELRRDLLQALGALEALATGELARHGVPPARRVARVCRGLPRLLRDVSVTGWAVDLHTLTRRAVGKIDAHPERILWGVCQCRAPLVSGKGAEWVKCRECGNAYESRALEEQRRDDVLDALAGAFLPVSALVDALRLMGFTVSQQAVSRWARSGKLTPDPGETGPGSRGGRPGRAWSVEDAVDCAERMPPRRGSVVK